VAFVAALGDAIVGIGRWSMDRSGRAYRCQVELKAACQRLTGIATR
jgi:hypothetical protein